MHIHKLWRTHAHTQTRVHTHTHTHAHTCITRTNTHKHTCSTRIHTYTHVHTRTHTHHNCSRPGKNGQLSHEGASTTRIPRLLPVFVCVCVWERERERVCACVWESVLQSISQCVAVCSWSWAMKVRSLLAFRASSLYLYVSVCVCVREKKTEKASVWERGCCRVCLSALQCVVVRCNALQCVAVCSWSWAMKVRTLLASRASSLYWCVLQCVIVCCCSSL